MEIPQLFDSHSGGQLAFGPDHYLYIALGDGSSYGDVLGNAQNRGLRNPWRFSFDSVNGKLLVGDVGQGRMEEINVVEKGRNYGWNIMEGTLPYRGSNENVTGLVPPIWEYGRDQGNATIGGFV